jgi:thymidylate synthase (FAD)
MIKYINDGFVEDIAHMGDDAFVSRVAGISHDNASGPGVYKLLEWGHVSPLEFGQIVFYIKAPLFVIRQWQRHRAFSYMEMSGRYTDMGENDMFIPIREEIRDEDYIEMNDILAHCYNTSFDSYRKMIDLGMPNELARIVLPLATYTEMYVRMDIRHLRDFLSLRLDKHAQYEMREYAEAIKEIAEEYFPQCLKAVL